LIEAFISTSKFSLSAWTNIYKNEFLQKNELKFISERITGSEDYLFNLKALLKVESINVIADCLYYYIQRTGSLTYGYKINMAEKYTEMYRQLIGHYAEAGELEKYQDKICRFYIWHLIHGACLINEYHETLEHSIAAGRKNVRMIFNFDEFEYAIKRCSLDGLTFKQKLQVKAMEYKLEPLFYLLYVVKPRLRKGHSR